MQHKQDNDKGLAQRVQSTRIKHSGISSIDRKKHSQKGIRVQVHLVGEMGPLSRIYRLQAHVTQNNKTTTKG